MFGDQKISIEIPKIQPTYIIFQRENKNFIQTPLTYSRRITHNEEKNITDTFLKETDNVVDVKVGREFKINEKLLSVHRYVHNELNLTYKEVLDVEIIYIEKVVVDNEVTRVSHRYPNEGRSAIDFQATILDTFVDCELDPRNFNSGNRNKMYVMVMVSNNQERRTIGELVNRYLFIEDQETSRSQSIYHMPRSPSRQRFRSYRQRYPPPRRSARTLDNTFSLFSSLFGQNRNFTNNDRGMNIVNTYDDTRFQNIQPQNSSLISSLSGSIINNSQGTGEVLSNIIGSSATDFVNNELPSLQNITPEHKINYEQKIQDLERQRENELNDIRNTMFNRNRGQEYEQPNENMFHGVDYDIIYTIGEDFPINNSINRQPFMVNSMPQINIFENIINLLRFVNNVSGSDTDFENLMEPVRVTVSEDKMDTFLTAFKYDPELDNLKIKDQKTCTICLSDYEKDENVSYLNTCNHLFHTTCVDKWLREFNHKCPVCRLSADPSKNTQSTNV